MATPLCGLLTFLFSDCSVCSKTYAPGLNFICQKCSDGTKGIAITVVIIVLIIACGLAIFSHLVSAEVGGGGRGIVDRVTRWVPMQSIKIIVVAWQILTQVREGTADDDGLAVRSRANWGCLSATGCI